MDSQGIGFIDHVIAGHYDTDHVGGLDNLAGLLGGISRFGVFHDRGGTLTYDGTAIPSQYLTLVDPSGKRSTVGVDGASDVDLGSGAAVRFMSVGAPDAPGALSNLAQVRGGGTIAPGSENNKSITALVTYGGFDFYFGSDAEGTTERAVDDVVAALGRQVDVLHVDHHGSDTNGISSPEFLANMGPEVAVISVWSNPFGHPRRATVQNLQAVVEPLPQRIIRLSPGDVGHPSWAPEDMSFCHTTNGHLRVTVRGDSSYTVSGGGITEPGLVNHPADQDGGFTPPPPSPPPSPHLFISADASSITAGDTLVVSWSFLDFTQRVDAYFGVVVPDGSLLVMDASGLFQARIVPVASDLLVAGNRSGTLSLSVPPGTAAGSYTLEAVAVPAGASVLNPANYLNGGIVTATVDVQ
jgi:hypothetical protein